jgi:pimeloyl-ACP methyl ester carboxylesterase
VESQAKPRLVYLPGIDGTGRLLHRQPRLSAEYDLRCVAYPQDRSTTYLELARLGAEALGPEGGIVLAESFGGGVALTLALAWPDRVKRLALVNTFAWYPHSKLIALMSLANPFLPGRPFPPRSRGLRGRLFFPAGTPTDDQDEWWSRTSDVPLWAYGMRLGMIARLDLRARLPRIEAPCSVVVSTNDRVVPPSAGRLLARQIPGARLYEGRYGHAAMIHPQLDMAAILQDD